MRSSKQFPMLIAEVHSSVTNARVLRLLVTLRHYDCITTVSDILQMCYMVHATYFFLVAYL